MFKNKFFSILVIGLVLFAAIIGYGYVLIQPVSSRPTTSTQFVVPKGQAVSVIGDRLKKTELIRSSLMFRLIVKQQGLEDKLQAGSFKLSADLSTIEIAHNLTEGTNDLWVTILEGWRREEVAASLVEAGLASFDEEEFLELTKDQEGRIFPDTYLFARESTAETVYRAIQNAFNKKVVQGLAEEIERSSHTLDEILIMASIVEREARGADEMRHVAGILWNRIDLEMALQADATLQYAKGYNTQTQSWWEAPLTADKKINSFFNTYLYPGLPPQPICNPGLDAIRAALSPAQTFNLYYLHDRSGEIHYGENLEEHNANVQQYLR